MADGNINLGIQVNLQDAGASAGLQKLSKEAEAAATRSGKLTADSGRRQIAETHKLATARSTLGVRAEREIQAEINRTIRSYERLAASGKLSMKELERAHETTKQKVTALINESGRLTKEQEKQARIDRRRNIGQKALIGIGGVTAAAATLREPAARAMAFDDRLSDYANIAGARQSIEVRRQMMKDMEQSIIKAYRYGGQTRDDVGEALSAMLASGAIEDEKDAAGNIINSAAKRAGAILPAVAKYATASSSSATDMGISLATAMQQYGIREDQAEGALNILQLGGAVGAFEVKDLAAALPEQIALSKGMGFNGMKGLAQLVAWDEAARKLAGTSGEAKTMVSAAMSEGSSGHFMRFLAQERYNGGRTIKRSNMKTYTERLNNELTEMQRTEGITRNEAIARMMDQNLSKDKRYVALKAELQSLDPKKDAERYQNVAGALEQQIGFNTGKVLHSKEARMGFIALMTNKDFINEFTESALAEVEAKVREGDTAHQLKKGQSIYQTRMAAQDTLTAQKAAMDSLTPAIGAAAKGFSDLASRYPTLIGVTMTTAYAVGAFGTAVGGATLALRVLAGTRPVPVGVPGGIPTTGGVVGRGKGATVTPAGGGRSIGRAMGIGAAATGGSMLLGQVAGDSDLARYGTNALTGMSLGATIGSVVPVIGTGFGAGIGALLGVIGTGLSDWLGDTPAQKIDVAVKGEFSLPPGVTLQNQETTVSGGSAQVNTSNTGNIRTGAPG